MTSESSEFAPLSLSFSEVRRSIPDHLFQRNTLRASRYLLQDVILAAMLCWAAMHIDPLIEYVNTHHDLHPWMPSLLYTACWFAYWWFQGLVFTGLWVIGHECGHGAFSSSRIVCNAIGFLIHTLLWTPYFSWKFIHQRHHANHASMEHDEVYIPKTRTELGIPKETKDKRIDYTEYFGDTPLWMLILLIRQQLLAFPWYLFANVSGRKDYPKWTNHFNPNAVFFSDAQRNAVWASNIGILTILMITMKAINMFGFGTFVRFYGIPWLFVSHWFVMITYLHHTSADLPHYREAAWNFQRGAAATVDRNFLGWQGRFFLHDVAHFHVIHHFFPQMPWYNGEEATEHLKKVLGPHYHRSDEPVFTALWRTYNICQFVEDDGNILFYKDKEGRMNRSVKANQ
ncbi:hypothetical protein ACEPAF_213 [Sanghuangporus sanghuang]